MSDDICFNILFLVNIEITANSPTLSSLIPDFIKNLHWATLMSGHSMYFKLR